MFGALARLLGEREGDQKAVESVKRAGLDSQFPAAARLFAPPVLRPMCIFTESCVSGQRRAQIAQTADVLQPVLHRVHFDLKYMTPKNPYMIVQLEA